MQQRPVFIWSRIPGLKFFCLALFLLLALAGCAAKAEKKVAAVFYPPPPNAPRVQFLKSINNSGDVEEDKKEFSLFVVGKKKSSDQVKEILKPYGVTYAKGKIYLSDMQTPTIVIMDLEAKTFETLQGNKGAGKLKKPVNVAVDESGNIFVVDNIREEVLMYDAAGLFIQSFGEGIINKPADVALDANNLYILDLGDSDIKILDRKSGQLIRKIGKTEGPMQGLSIPTNIAADGKGIFYTSNVGTGNIIKLDRDGHILASFGKVGDAFGEFVRPKGVAVDPKGRIFVVDAGHQNLQIFNDEFRLLMFFGNTPGQPGVMNLPAGVVVTTENLEFFQKMAAPGFVLEEVIMVTNQMGPDRLSIYGLGQMADGAAVPAEADRQSDSALPAQGK